MVDGLGIFLGVLRTGFTKWCHGDSPPDRDITGDPRQQPSTPGRAFGMPSCPKTSPRRPKVAWRPEKLWGEWLGMELWIFHQQRWEFHIFHGHSERNIADVPRCLLFGTPHYCSTSKKWIWRGGRPLLPCFGVVALSLMMYHTHLINPASKHTPFFGEDVLGPVSKHCTHSVLQSLLQSLGFYLKAGQTWVLHIPSKTSQQKRTTSCGSLGPRFYISHVCMTFGDWDHN